MLLDEIFGEVSLKDIQRYIAKKALRESPIDMAKPMMVNIIKVYLTQMFERDIDSIPLSSLTKEIMKMGGGEDGAFANIDERDIDLLIDLLKDENDKYICSFIDKVEPEIDKKGNQIGVIYFKQHGYAGKDVDVDDQNKAAAESNVDNMAKNAVNKDLKGGDKL